VIRILVFTHRFQWDVVVLASRRRFYAVLASRRRFYAVLAARRTCRLFLRQDEPVAAKKFV
jgi:hypothetical protein